MTNQMSLRYNLQRCSERTEETRKWDGRVENSEGGINYHFIHQLSPPSPLGGSEGVVRLTGVWVPRVAFTGEEVHLVCEYGDPPEDGPTPPGAGGGLYSFIWYKVNVMKSYVILYLQMG